MKHFFLLPALLIALLVAPLPIFAANMTPMQAAAHQLRNDLNQALDESTFNADQRYRLMQDATVLVQSANRRAAGHRFKRRKLRHAAKELLKSFDSGDFQVGDAMMLNNDFKAFKKSIR